MPEWRDFEEGRRGISIGDLSDGESISVFVDESPYLNEEEIEQSDGSTETSESLRVPCMVVENPNEITDMNDDDIEAVDIEVIEDTDGDLDVMKYDIINSSTAFKKAFRDAYPDGISPVGAVATIAAHQPDPSDTFGRKYSVESNV